MAKRDLNSKARTKKVNQEEKPLEEDKVNNSSNNQMDIPIEESQQILQKKTKKSRIENIEKNLEILETNETKTGVVYLGHLPWGFDEVGIKKYFEQFGKITRIFVPRSKRTGRTKGYGFIEFEDKVVAEIAAKTMNNYILFEKILKCSVVEETSRYNTIFKNCKRKFKFNNKYQTYLKEKNKFKSKEEMIELVKLLLEKEEQKRTKFKEMGIKYDYPGYSAIIEKHRSSMSSNKKKTQKEKQAQTPTEKSKKSNKKSK